MKPVCIAIQAERTGKRIQELFRINGYTVRDVQEAMGFTKPQAIYKWLSGQSLPSVDNLVVLSRILHTSIDNILVVDGDIAFRENRYCFFMLLQYWRRVTVNMRATRCSCCNILEAEGGRIGKPGNG
ncbi:MAG: helix-turn-helix transcriptional regulator [Eubacteriales bacterium]|nr:helix-turn-helix transcriptional regulator [Eubacteriales bacterium]